MDEAESGLLRGCNAPLDCWPGALADSSMLDLLETEIHALVLRDRRGYRVGGLVML